MKTKTDELPQAVIFVDAHPSRRNFELMNAAKNAKIDVITTPAHTTHLTQALDCVVNARLKRLLQNVTNKDGSENFEAFLWSLEDAIEEACLGKNIRKSFRACGLVPFDPEVVLRRVPDKLALEVVEKITKKGVNECI